MLIRNITFAPIRNFRVILKPSSRFLSSLSDKQYHLLADRTLEYVTEYVDNDIIEASYSQGVLKIDINSKSWVLNKQSPNKQIWWSSPLSGPLRYEYIDSKEKGPEVSDHVLLLSQWKCTRDGSSLFDQLRKELLEVSNFDILDVKL